MSTTVVSSALATGLYTLRPLTFRSRGGESSSRDHSPWCVSRMLAAIRIGSSANSVITVSDWPGRPAGGTGAVASAGNVAI